MKTDPEKSFGSRNWKKNEFPLFILNNFLFWTKNVFVKYYSLSYFMIMFVHFYF